MKEIEFRKSALKASLEVVVILGLIVYVLYQNSLHVWAAIVGVFSIIFLVIRFRIIKSKKPLLTLFEDSIYIENHRASLSIIESFRFDKYEPIIRRDFFRVEHLEINFKGGDRSSVLIEGLEFTKCRAKKMLRNYFKSNGIREIMRY